MTNDDRHRLAAEAVDAVAAWLAEHPELLAEDLAGPDDSVTGLYEQARVDEAWAGLAARAAVAVTTVHRMPEDPDFWLAVTIHAAARHLTGGRL